MAKQMGLAIIVLVLLMITVEIKGGNRFQSITTCCIKEVKINGGNRYLAVTTTCCKGGTIYPSTESPAPSLSPSESPLTMPLVAPLPAKTRYVVNSRVGGIQ
ncbi:hypothetical protein ACET3Z_022675 [Daucus carota]